MSPFKKYWKLGTFTFLILLTWIFHKPIIETFFGVGIRLAVRWQMDCRLAYRSIEWKNGGFLFSDVVLFDAKAPKSSFHAHAEKMEIGFDWSRFFKKGHLQVVRPHVIFFGQRNWNGGRNWFDLSAVIEEGIVEWPGIERAYFSYEKSAPDHLGRLHLGWNEGMGLDVEAVQEGKSIQIDAELKQLQGGIIVKLLQFYLPQMGNEIKSERGNVKGTVHLITEEGTIQTAQAHLEMDQIGIQVTQWKIDGWDGRLDWEGPLSGKTPISIFNHISCDGHFRGAIDRMNLHIPGARVENLKGNFSYNPGMGAKWDFQAIASSTDNLPYPFQWEGKGYFHSQIENWIQSNLSLGEMSLLLHGYEKEGKRIWRANIEKLEAGPASMILAFSSLLYPELQECKFNQGTIHTEANFCFSDTGLESWDFSKIVADHLSISLEESYLGCERLEGHLSQNGGELKLKGGDFEIPLPEGNRLIGTKWEGLGIWVDGELAPSRWSGSIGNVETAFEVMGKWKNWKAKGELSGSIAGKVFLGGVWEGDSLLVEIEKGEIEGVVFSGSGSIDRKRNFSLQIPSFQGRVDSLSKLFSGFSFGGEISGVDEGILLRGNFDSWDWSLKGAITRGKVSKGPYLNLENIRMSLFAGPEEIAAYGIEGDFITSQGKIPFDCPLIRNFQANWDFDIRLKNSVWDLFRVCGRSSGEEILFEESKCHFLGAPFSLTNCRVKEGKLIELDAGMVLSWNSILAAGPFLESLGIQPAVDKPIQGSAGIHFDYVLDKGASFQIQGIDLTWKGKKIPLDFVAKEENGIWNLDLAQVGDLFLSCRLIQDEKKIEILDGTGDWKEGIKANFAGKLEPGFRWDLFLSEISIDLSELNQWTKEFSLGDIRGKLVGSGHLRYDRTVEMDLDVSVSDLEAGSLTFENKGILHIFYSSEKGVMFSGIDLQVMKEQLKLACKVEVLQFDALRSHWISTRSHVHLTPDFFTFFPQLPFPAQLKQELDFIADIDCASDFSLITCSMKEGFFPFQGTVRHIQDLNLKWRENQVSVDFHYLHQGHLLKLGANIGFDPIFQGKWVFEDEEVPEERPLSVYWAYDRELTIHSIEGSFGGIEASFQAQSPDVLIGSARVDFKALSEIIPPVVAEAFHELEMGKGYEFKGKLTLEKEGPRFQGLLSGKQIELFGYQLRTLLAQIDLTLDEVSITNLKISDMAGILKADDIWFGGKEEEPWTISIPKLTLTELRPSLLHRVGQEAGEISPLVVRELTLRDFQGLLDEGKTWTATGDLHFINSYKREYTVFDLPADVLSRIVGLDLELLIPVRGYLTFDLKDGYAHLLELTDSFSEASRSQFFLAKEDLVPTMDLDGNLKILVKMKQFILFKFTEAFLISIEGKLNDPKFHLQKKKRFLGI